MPWLQLLLVTYSLGNIAIAWLLLPLLPATIMGIFNTLLVAGVTALLLSCKGFISRLHQSLSALMGCGTLLNALSFPLATMANNAPEITPLLAALNMWLVLWGFAVSVHIIRCALSVTAGLSLLINIGLFVFYYVVGQKTLQFLS